MAKGFKSFETHPNLSPYAGRWVALLRGRVVGQGGTPQQAIQAAKASRHKEHPKVIYVPTSQHPLAFSPLLDKIRLALPANQPIYLAGGAVRDALMNRPTHDLDFALPGDAINVARRVANTLKVPFFPLDAERGTGRVVLPQEGGGRYMLDFAALRGPDIDSDLRARDFTINAMAVDVRAPDSLLDPLGGVADLLAKRLRACSPTTFEDDPIRILRAIRQAAAYGLKIVPETRRRMREAVDRLPDVSPERQRDELFRILAGEQPAASLRALDIIGVLPHLLPEVLPLKGITQSPPHIYDVWQHTLQTIQKLDTLLGVLGTLEYNPDSAASLAIGLAVLRLGRYRQQINTHVNTAIIPDRPWRGLLFLAALYHDTGKPETREEENGRVRFLKHEHAGTSLIARRARALHLSNAEISRLKNIVRGHMRPHHLAQSGKPPTRRAIYRFFRDTREAGVDVCLLNLADVLATYGVTLPQETWVKYLDVIRELLEAWWEKPEESVKPPTLLNGHDLIREFGLEPGPKIGELLEMVRETQVTGRIESREQALGFVDDYLKNL